MTAIALSPSTLGPLLRAMFGVTLLPEKPLEAMTWEDDGGSLTVESEGYEHTLTVEPALTISDRGWPPLQASGR